MPYLIDSDVVIDHLADVAAATTLLEQLASEGIAVSIITYMEAYQGVLRSPHQTRARKKFEAFLETVPVLPIALEYSLTIVTRNVEDYEDIRGLKLYKAS